jgi:hypothetical protein
VRWKTDPLDGRLDLGHELDRRSAGANHRHALAAEIVIVIPPRRVNVLP